MATVRKNWAGTASTTEPNILTGTKFETLRRPCAIRVYGVMDTVAGPPVGSVQATLSVGNVVIAEDLILPKVATAGEGPDRDKHLLTRGVGHTHDLVQLKLQETGGSNTPARVLVDIEEIV